MRSGHEPQTVTTVRKALLEMIENLAADEGEAT